MADRKKLGDTIYKEITDMILRQEIACGDKIAVDSLSKKLGVSRTPVTEAIQRLAKEGIVKLSPHRSAEVIELTKKDITDLGLTRVALDTLAVQLAVRNGSDAEFDELRKVAQQCYDVAKSGDIFNWIRLECEFHLGLAKIGKNENLSKIMEDLYLKVRLLQFVTYEDSEVSLNMIKLHFDIIDKLKERDVDGVISFIHKHLAYFYDLNDHAINTIRMNF
ncbi:MAG: GntR family transcriptional regulator [Spirochaetales bacterium]|nr:GntR family transcriptional regulator [Spirochaetales bacterium]